MKRPEGMEEHEIAHHGDRQLENKLRKRILQGGFITPKLIRVDSTIITLFMTAAHFSPCPPSPLPKGLSKLNLNLIRERRRLQYRGEKASRRYQRNNNAERKESNQIL
ncbi:hypothetical protein Nepgr_022213 [Nepenthes gracilis]|uniref:Uncharacterized protein n=1 Tax=Nepenthes gracilis TaxID=150966 RepID=A0AAD3T1E7_NEPGR|nr:hypothetical protein Nepgr_022213 [Nepenthes gracilis]